MSETLYLMYLLIALPFAAVGVYFLLKNFILPQHWYAKRGYIKVYQLLPNGRVKYTYAKPKHVKDVGYELKIKDRVFQYIDAPDYYFFEGNLKCAFYDEQGNQVSIKEMQKLMPSLSPEMLDALMQRTWNTAKIAAFKKADRIEQLLWIILIAAGLAVVISGVTAFKVSDLAQQILLLKKAASTSALTPA